jgi:hypothetical protein
VLDPLERVEQFVGLELVRSSATALRSRGRRARVPACCGSSRRFHVAQLAQGPIAAPDAGGPPWRPWRRLEPSAIA